MLDIREVSGEEHFKRLREKENKNRDYLYILKHKCAIVLSDNGTLIPLSGSSGSSGPTVSEDELNESIQDILNNLKEEGGE